jgi:hypothetical protein
VAVLKENAENTSNLTRKEIMSRMSRRSFVSTSIGGATLAAMATVNSAEGQLVYTRSDWKVSDFNQLARHPAQVKQVYDVTQIAQGGFETAPTFYR